MSWGENPYDNPAKHGLEIVYEDEQQGGYEFDKFVVWRSINGTLFTDYDSGCSCPSPFEGLSSVIDLEQAGGADEVIDRYAGWLTGYGRDGDTQPLRAALAREAS